MSDELKRRLAELQAENKKLSDKIAELEESEARRQRNKPDDEKALANRLAYSRPSNQLRMEYALVQLASAHRASIKDGFETFKGLVSERTLLNLRGSLQRFVPAPVPCNHKRFNEIIVGGSEKDDEGRVVRELPLHERHCRCGLMEQGTLGERAFDQFKVLVGKPRKRENLLNSLRNGYQ